VILADDVAIHKYPNIDEFALGEQILVRSFCEVRLHKRKKFAEVEAENTKVKVENMKLKQILKEHEIRFTKLEYDVSLIKKEVAISPEINSDNTPTEFISPLIESQSEEKKVIIPDPMPEYNSIQVQRSESKSLSEPGIFTTSLSQGQDIINDNTAETLDFVETINTTIEITQLEPSPIDQVQSNITSEIKIPYNQKVEQGLMGELSGCSKENIAIQDVDIQIPNLPLETILIGSDEVTAEIIVDLTTNINDTINCQEVISILKKNAHVTESSSSNDLSSIKISEEAKISILPISQTEKKAFKSINPVSPKIQVNTSNKSRSSISVLPDDPKEKQKHVIKMALEWFPVLSLKY
ncbi:9684_t:CDS:2, partial [Ambispora gerdemannii]